MAKEFDITADRAEIATEFGSDKVAVFVPFAAPIEAAPSPAETMIRAWFIEYFHNSPLSRDAENFNLAQAARDDLIKRFSKGL